ncbi:hypothetical protein [Tellurirhabdus bombi]|uniref:hypothetical protein n=1 Tax=Tellurirhabdus bombi TaxID=2907205 RepID=UPI001F40BB5D|nr:hypothetical protein [Tellurirhabdus bombi]
MIFNPIAHFASQHQRLAAALILVAELSNAAIGLTVGSALLEDQPGWYLSLLIAGLVVIRLFYRQYAAIRLLDLVSTQRFQFQKQSYTILFLINLLTFTVAGGISGRTIAHPEPSTSVASNSFRITSASSRQDTLIRQSPPKQAYKPEVDKIGTRLGYVFLFLAGLGLSVLTAGLACNIACAGQGFAAVLVLLLGVGILAGGIYFLGRAIDKTMKFYKEMVPAERSREGRRFLRTLLGTVAALALLIFVPSLFN